MSIEKLVSKYLYSAENVIKEMLPVEDVPRLDSQKVNDVVEYARNYLKDAKYYREKKRFEVSLASIAYCEGLLDALRLLGAVKFEWSKSMGMAKGRQS